MKRILVLCVLAALLLGNAGAERIQYSERCMKIKQAEQAIQSQYQIIPDIYTFLRAASLRRMMEPLQ